MARAHSGAGAGNDDPFSRGRPRSLVGGSTLDSYERNVRLHVIPRLGNVALQQFAPEDLDGFYADLLDGGRRDGGGGLRHKTVRYIHGILHKVLADAQRKGTILRNVAVLERAISPRRGIGGTQ